MIDTIDARFAKLSARAADERKRAEARKLAAAERKLAAEIAERHADTRNGPKKKVWPNF